MLAVLMLPTGKEQSKQYQVNQNLLPALKNLLQMADTQEKSLQKRLEVVNNMNLKFCQKDGQQSVALDGQKNIEDFGKIVKGS